MGNPTVSFVVPCYKLAHLLPECVNSILSQTYGDLEVLILDDCSPDNTTEVTGKFQDRRVRYVRNETNLGALRNFNKGISMSRGKYVWLISADDYLRRPYILERYVEAMEANPRAGFTCCPGIHVRGGKEGGVWRGSEYGSRDGIVDGHVFLKALLRGNLVLAPSAMARRECYEISMFPLEVTWAGRPIDLVWGGDWYLWCVFALFFDVAYFAEPMVCYREHDLSMTNVVTQKNKSADCAATEIGTVCMVREKAMQAGMRDVSRECLKAIALHYSRHCGSQQYEWLDQSSTSHISIAQAEEWLSRSMESERERKWVLARIFTRLGDDLWYQDPASARGLYLRALKHDPVMAKSWLKFALLLSGKLGDRLRRAFWPPFERDPAGAGSR